VEILTSNGAIVLLALDATIFLSLEFIERRNFRFLGMHLFLELGLGDLKLQFHSSLVKVNNTFFFGMNMLYFFMPNYMWFMPLKVYNENLMCG
jgi:hypothetical protein